MRVTNLKTKANTLRMADKDPVSFSTAELNLKSQVGLRMQTAGNDRRRICYGCSTLYHRGQRWKACARLPPPHLVLSLRPLLGTCASVRKESWTWSEDELEFIRTNWIPCCPLEPLESMLRVTCKTGQRLLPRSHRPAWRGLWQELGLSQLAHPFSLE